MLRQTLRIFSARNAFRVLGTTIAVAILAGGSNALAVETPDFKITLPQSWKLEQEGPYSGYFQQDSAKKQVVTFEKLEVSSEQTGYDFLASKRIRIERERARLFEAFGFERYTILSIEEHTAKNGHKYQVIHSRYYGPRGQDVQMYERQYPFGGTLFRVTYTEESRALNNLEKVRQVLDNVQPIVPKGWRKPASDNEIGKGFLTENPAEPRRDLLDHAAEKLGTRASPEYCADVLESERYTQDEGRSWLGKLWQGAGGMGMCVIDQLKALLVDLPALIIRLGITDEKLQDQVKAAASTLWSELKKDPIGTGTKVWTALSDELGKSIPKYQCYRLSRQVEFVCNTTITAAMLFKLLLKAPLELATKTALKGAWATASAPVRATARMVEAVPGAAKAGYNSAKSIAGTTASAAKTGAAKALEKTRALVERGGKTAAADAKAAEVNVAAKKALPVEPIKEPVSAPEPLRDPSAMARSTAPKTQLPSDWQSATRLVYENELVPRFQGAEGGAEVLSNYRRLMEGTAPARRESLALQISRAADKGGPQAAEKLIASEMQKAKLPLAEPPPAPAAEPAVPVGEAKPAKPTSVAQNFGDRMAGKAPGEASPSGSTVGKTMTREEISQSLNPQTQARFERLIKKAGDKRADKIVENINLARQAGKEAEVNKVLGSYGRMTRASKIEKKLATLAEPPSRAERAWGRFWGKDPVTGIRFSQFKPGTLQLKPTARITAAELETGIRELAVRTDVAPAVSKRLFETWKGLSPEAREAGVSLARSDANKFLSVLDGFALEGKGNSATFIAAARSAEKLGTTAPTAVGAKLSAAGAKLDQGVESMAGPKGGINILGKDIPATRIARTAAVPAAINARNENLAQQQAAEGIGPYSDEEGQVARMLADPTTGKPPTEAERAPVLEAAIIAKAGGQIHSPDDLEKTIQRLSEVKSGQYPKLLEQYQALTRKHGPSYAEKLAEKAERDGMKGVIKEIQDQNERDHRSRQPARHRSSRASSHKARASQASEPKSRPSKSSKKAHPKKSAPKKQHPPPTEAPPEPQEPGPFDALFGGDE